MPTAQIPRTPRPDEAGTEVAELVAAARRGEPRAWDELIGRYGGLVRAVVGRYRLQPADAADAVQNTWCKAVEQLAAVRDPERLGAWLTTTANRECLALIRRARREWPDDKAVEARPATGPGPEAVVLAAEVAGVIGTAVEALEPRRRRLVYELFYLPERDYASVSRSTGMPVGSIGPTRGRLLVSLRSRLQQAGFGSPPPVGELDRFAGAPP